MKQRVEDREIILDLTIRLTRLERESRRRRLREQREYRSEPALINEACTPWAFSRCDHDTNPLDEGWASPDDYVLAQLERIEGQLGEIRKQIVMDEHQSLQTTARFNEQLAELGSKVGVLNMHTTWLMNMQRQTHAQQQRTGSETAPPAAGLSQIGDSSTTRVVPSENGVRYQAGSRRSSSSGRREHPPRL
jgi:hypothetical protein